MAGAVVGADCNLGDHTFVEHRDESSEGRSAPAHTSDLIAEREDGSPVSPVVPAALGDGVPPVPLHL
jgi:hypothetical protein